jgi:hypothetical protein
MSRNAIFAWLYAAIEFDCCDGEIKKVGAVVDGDCDNGRASVAEDC